MDIKDIINKLNSLPHSILLLGEEGSGQSDIYNYISDKFNLSLNILSNDMITHETIDKIFISSEPTLYIIYLNEVTEKEQDILLKVYEEPNPFSYLILMADDKYNVLETICSRSYILNMPTYTPAELSKMYTGDNPDLMLSICHTPGQVELANHTDLNALEILCTNMITKMDKANIANALTISNKINFKDEYSKFDLKLFIRALGYVITKLEKYNLYKYLNEFNKRIWFMNDKKSYFDGFVIDLWKLTRGVYGHW